ncbi:hypothetical protein ACU4GD_01010, partial [Cupriavidus basilensis]
AAVFGALQLWLLARVAIDHRLFAALADISQGAGTDEMLGSLDQALVRLGWTRPGPAGAPWRSALAAHCASFTGRGRWPPSSCWWPCCYCCRDNGRCGFPSWWHAPSSCSRAC